MTRVPPTARVLAIVAVAPWLAVASALPPEHVHGTAGAHRHVAVHQHAAAHDHDATEIEENDDDHVVWLDDIGIAEAVRTCARLAAAVPAHLEIFAEPIAWVAAATDEATLPHGPPGSSASLRAPPSACFLI